MSQGSEAGRDRIFAAFAEFGLRRRGLLALIVLSLLGASLWMGRDMKIQTSRYGLVSEENAYQKRMIDFFERFGYPDAPVFVIRGGDEAQRRAIVDGISEQLEVDPMFEGRVFGRLGAESIAEVLLLQEPGALAELREQMGEEVDLSSSIEKGVPGLLLAVEAQLLGGLDAGTAESGEPEKVDDGLRRLGQLATVLDLRLKDGDVDGALDELLEDAEGEDSKRPETLPVDARGYLTTHDGESLLIAVFPDFKDDSVDTYAPVVKRLGEIRDANRVEGVEVLLTGTPVMAVDDEKNVTKGLLVSGAATGAGIFLILLLAFRSLRSTVIALVPLGAGVGMSVGLLVYLYGGLNLVTSSFAAVLMGLGIDLSVHLLARYQEELRAGADRIAAIRTAVTCAGPGVFVGAMTTVLAFLTLLDADFTAYGELGGISALGLGLTFLCAMTILPALVASPRLSGGAKPPPPMPGLAPIMAGVRRWPRVWVLGGGLAMVAGGACLSMLHFNTNYFAFLPDEAESARALKVLEKDGAMTPVFAFTSAPDIESSREMAARLRALESVQSVQSVTDMMPPLSEEERLEKLRKSFEGLRAPDFSVLETRTRTRDELVGSITAVVDALDEVKFALEQAGRETAAVDQAREAYKALSVTAKALPDDGGPELAKLEQLLAEVLGRAWKTGAAVAERGSYAPEDLPALFHRRHVARDGSGAVSLYVYPQGDLWDRERAETFAGQVESVDPQAAGLAMNVHYHMSMVLSDFRQAALIAGGLVFIMLLLNLRRFSDAMLAMAPALMGWCWMLGTFVLFDISLNVANIVVLPLILGIGVDAGAHVVHRVRQSAEQHGGVARLEDLFSGTGGAVLLSSVTTAVGFGGLMMAEHGGMYYFGLVMVIGVMCTLVASLLFLPATLVLLGRAR